MDKFTYLKIPEKDRMNSVLEGTAYFASLHTPNMSGVKLFNAPPEFVISLGVDAANAQKALDMGLKILPADKYIPEPYVKIKRKVITPKTAEDVKPTVVDSQQKVIPDHILVGNGSKVRVKFGTYWYDNNGGGVNTTLFKVQVLSLVKFVSKGDRSFVMDEGGFSVDDFDAMGEGSINGDSYDGFPASEEVENIPTKPSGKKAATATNSDIFDD